MISIVVPSYNHGLALPGLLDSLRAQTDNRYEVIIVDDGSTDDTAAIIEHYRQSCSAVERARLRYVRVPHAGAPAARNAGSRQAGGTYLLFADADLLLRKDYLKKLRTALATHPEASYAYSGFRFGWKKFAARPFDPVALRQQNFIHTSALIRREHFPGFDETLERFQDWDLWLTMLEHGRVGVSVPGVLFRARVTRFGISKWRPRIWYDVWGRVASWVGGAPEPYRQYIAAKRIVERKHGLR